MKLKDSLHEKSQYKMYIKHLKNVLRWFTPIGEADGVVDKYLSEEEQFSNYYDRYKKAFRKYVYFKRINISVKTLLSASFISSAAAALGFGLEIINRLASYIGFSVLIASYLLSRYFVLRYRENLYVHREILLTESKSQ